MKKNKRKQNGFDNLFEAIYKGVTKTKNHHLVLESPIHMEYYTFFLQHLIDIQNYYLLYKNSFIPAANKAVFITSKEYSKSKYKPLLNISEEEIKENLFETVRLGYVGLSHKIEGFTKGIKKKNELIKQVHDISGAFKIKEYMEVELGIDFLNPINTPCLNKIRIISNAVKHNNGYPQEAVNEKDNIWIHLPKLNGHKKICIEPTSFLKDIKFTVEYFELINVLINVFSLLKNETAKEYRDESYNQKTEETISKFKDLVKLYTQLANQSSYLK